MRNAPKAEDVAFERLEAVRAEIPAIERRRHPHGHDHARRAAGQPLFPQRIVAFTHESETRAGHLLKKSLEQCRHAPEPEWKEKHQVLGPLDGRLRIYQIGRHRAVFPFVLAVQ